MKKMIASLGVLGLVAVSASALQLQCGPGYGPYQTGQGGEFSLAVVSGSLDLSGYSSDPLSQTRGLGVNANSFQTFCIEDGVPAEYIYQNQVMDAVQSTHASYGSVVPGGDHISVGTGWLYSQFARGVWEGTLSYDYVNPGRSGSGTASAYLLQQAIWLLEQEFSDATAVNNVYVAALVAKFGSVDLARVDGGENYGVYALNLTYNGEHRQDQLYYNGHRVPDGGMTLAMLGIAVAGVVGLRRRLH